ncbi:MAG TPA: hypothetical protein VLL72_07670 [Kiloniellales bacterium]|nr:hypothetical protein [Kiloniellales bacterium]
MLRALLTVLLPILLPIAVYLGYAAYLRRRAELTGSTAEPRWQEGPWPWLFAAGAAVAVAGLILLRTGGVPPGTQLEAPRYEDGRIVPGRPVPDPAPE